MLSWFSELMSRFASWVISVLPSSPFAPYIERFSSLPYLGWLNWLIPIRACLIIFNSWLGAVIVFYVFSIILRWLKIIGD